MSIKLPWKIIKDPVYMDSIVDAEGKMVHANDEFECISKENTSYAVDACNTFPEVVEALRMVLHDTCDSTMIKNAEDILYKACDIMEKNQIKVANYNKTL